MKHDHTKTASFYDDFNKLLVSDYLNGNPRVEAQRKFFLDAIDSEVSSILVVGCGLGDVTYDIARS
mgnify:CR=1 FL=1